MSTEATCVIGGDVSVETTGVMHVLHDVESETLRLRLVRQNEETIRHLGEPAGREPLSLKQCEACMRVLLSMRGSSGQDLLFEYDPSDAQPWDKEPDEADRP